TATRARRLLMAACVIWLLVAADGFSTLLTRAPSVTSRGGAAAQPSAGAGPNVILISVDTLRADHLSCYGYGKPTSPTIDRLAAEGVRFEQASSTASFTLPSHASMMTGLFPSSHGATYQNRDSRSFTVSGMGTGYPTLAEILRDHGYDTAGFVSGPLLSRQFGFSRGFSHYDDRYDRLQTARARLFSRSLAFRALERAGLFSGRDIDSQRIASEVNPLVEDWLRARQPRDRPFFLFVHYWDPHGPYEPPAPWGVRPDGSPIVVSYDLDRLLTGEYTLSPRALADTLELYDGEVSFVDRSLGELVEMLRRDGTLDNSLLIFTADHGESFGEHAHWEHSRVLYEDVLHVPFIVRLPAGRAAGTIVRDVIAQPTDILPMALSVAGLPIPGEVEGRDLTRWIGGGVAPQPAQAGVKAPGLAFAELDRNIDWPSRWGARFDHDLVSARTLRWKYIRSSTGREELYDLERDAAELHDLSAADPNTTATLRALTDVWRKTLHGPAGEHGTGEIDEGLKDNLRSLGYIQ
ncbi:MAG TPA: sulfatase, partial [Patescibacteria group bacterium]|nr:sulfatase [Patescibacteria group bacterium]